MLFKPITALWALLLFIAGAQAQFQFFEHMFGGGQQQEHHQQEQQDVASDSSWYQRTWDGGMSFHPVFYSTSSANLKAVADINASLAHCSKYLCPGTLACVHFPHHCPCPHPNVEEKVELGEGSAICVSKGGFKPGEASRKIELARKGLL
jgi:hypothetical protein